MNAPTKLVFAALAVLVAILAVMALLNRGNTDDPGPAPIPATQRQASKPAEALSSADTVAPIPQPIPAPPPIKRRELTPTDERLAAQQGLRGRVVDSSGTPVEGAEVLLFTGNARNPLAALLAAQRGASAPPITRAVSDDRGRFAVGVQRVSQGGYELRITHPDFAHRAVPEVTLFDDRWIELDDVALDAGVSIEGRVTVQGGGGLPVPNAIVTVMPVGSLPSVGSLGSREPERTGIADAGGNYRIEHCADGLATVAAVAPGFARVERQAAQISRDVQNRINFELPKGETIVGFASDADGNPISGASIDAFALSAKTPVRLSARTDADGRFEVIGLVQGPYQLTAAAPGYVNEKIQPVSAGSQDEHIVLHRRSTIEVRVTSSDGRAVPRFDIALKSYDEQRDQIGHVPSSQLHRVVADDLVNGRYPLDGVEPGAYVVQVSAHGYAKTFSAPFTIERGAPPEHVDVVMLQGGELSGTVFGEDGRPIADVEVTTLPNQHEDNVLTRMFDGMVPDRITRVAVRTGANGKFRFEQLAPGTYQLRLRHPAHYELRRNDLVVGEGAITDAGDITLGRGAELVGTAILDGVPAGQIRVQVSSTPDPGNPSAPMFQAEAVTDDTGRFRLPKRIPPGHYQARAARQTTPNPLLQVLDFSKTRQDFQITRGQESQQVHFSLTSD